jgi:hypothetical protein
LGLLIQGEGGIRIVSALLALSGTASMKHFQITFFCNIRPTKYIQPIWQTPKTDAAYAHQSRIKTKGPKDQSPI